MGRHHYTKDYKVTVGPQGQRRTYYDHDNPREHQPQSRGGSVNRVWRRPDKRVSFNEKRGAIVKRGGPRGGGAGGRPRFDTSRVAALLETDEDMRGGGGGPSHQAGRARPATRGIRGKFRGMRSSGGLDRSRFVKLAPLSDDNKTKIQEAMSKRYNPANKALNLDNFGADNTFGGSSNAIGRLSDERVMECVVDTIGQHLSDLEAVNLSNNRLRTLRVFAKAADKAPNIKIIYLEKNDIGHSRELDFLSKLNLVEIKLDENPFLGNFKDGSHYVSVVQKKFKSLRLLDGKELPKLISFEEDDSTPKGPRAVDLPSLPKMVVDDQVGAVIGKFLELYFKLYDSDNREKTLETAYHEEAMMSMMANLPRSDPWYDYYIPKSRNLRIDAVMNQPNRREALLHQKRLHIMGFLDILPKTRHDLTSFTLDVPFATGRLVTFSVSGAFKERAEKGKPPPQIRHFSRMFVVVPQGDGLCIVNDSYFITTATPEQVDKSTSIFSLAEQTGMNVHWSKICLEGQNWSLERAVQAFGTAKQEGKIPAEAFD